MIKKHFRQTETKMLLSSLLVSVISTLPALTIGSAIARARGQRAQKAPSASTVGPANGYYLVNRAVPQQDAASVCAEEGWRLAEFTDETEPWARELMVRLGDIHATAWIAAFNGLSRNPCMFYGIDLVVPGHECDGVSLVFCQVPPPSVTTTTTTTASAPISSGVRTVTRTKTRFVRETGRCKALIEGDKRHCPEASAGAEACNCCTGVCPDDTVNKDIKLILKAVPNEEAACECAKRGMVLIDYTTGMLAAVDEVLNSCLTRAKLIEFGVDGVWMRSLDGVVGGMCQFGIIEADVDPSTLTFFPIWVMRRCEALIGLGFPLCQKPPPAITGSGPFELYTSTETVTSTSRRVTPSATLTVTVTETEVVQCRYQCD